jgi:hypothetical protein
MKPGLEWYTYFLALIWPYSLEGEAHNLLPPQNSFESPGHGQLCDSSLTGDKFAGMDSPQIHSLHCVMTSSQCDVT